MKKIFLKVFLLYFLFPLLLIAQGDPVLIKVDASKKIGKMKPVWAFFGYDEPNYTYTENGQKLLSEISRLSPVPVFIRTHNLLTTQEGSPDLKWGFTNAYTEDDKGNAVYDWKILDQIFDTYIQKKMKPLAEIGFMPKALSVQPEPYKHTWSKGGKIWTGWTYPPKDYKKWAELVYQWVKHCIERYGRTEVESWLWQVWNEPDIGYWSGTFEEFCMLYDFAADALKRACPNCTIGGPHTTNPGSEKSTKYLTGFLQHCLHEKNYATGLIGSPLEFVAFHAKGRPDTVNGHVRMNMGAQLKSIAKGFEIVNSFPELKNIPIIIGECDPEGCAACSEKRTPQYAYRNGTMYSSYTASSFARIYELMDKYNVNLKGALSWSFEFENQEWFAGFRDLATNGVDKPVLNVFRMYGMMNGNRIEVKTDSAFSARQIIGNGVREKPDVNAMASKDKNSIAIMVWNYHDDDLPSASTNVVLQISGIGGKNILLHHYRIDKDHSNSFEKWKSMGKPQDVNKDQFGELEKAGQLEMLVSPGKIKTDNGKATIQFDLPRQGVSLIRLTW